MATETIKIENGTLTVERNAPGKQNLEVSLSDVDSVGFERGGEAEGKSDGSLIIYTKDGTAHPIRVADNEAGKYLKALYEANEKPAAKAAPKADTK